VRSPSKNYKILCSAPTCFKEFRVYLGSGVLSTAGNLVFSGSNEGNSYALDALTDQPLWDFQTGGLIGANPISFNVDGHQRIAFRADRVLYAFGL
jgi:alcohol dehydrogenase (cytochrome c)